MIKQKSAEDKALYRRAKKAVENGDDSMKPIVEWYEGRRTPTREKYPVQFNLRRRIISREGGIDPPALMDKYGAYYNFWQRLSVKRYDKVPEDMARKMLAELSGETYEPEPQNWEDFYKVREFLLDVPVLKKWCRKHDIHYQKCCRIRQDTYKNVPDVVEEILEIIE